MNYKETIEKIRQELKTYIQENNLQSLILGVSGGIDSTLVAAIAKPVCEELNIPLIGRSLPIESNKQDEINRARLVGESFCTKFRQENLEEIFNKLAHHNPDPRYIYNESIDKLGLSEQEMYNGWKIRNGNIKARLRMIYLYNEAAINSGVVLGTGNYTEYLLGFFTLHGDAAYDIGILNNFWKSEVYDMSEWIRDNECNIQKEKDCLTLSIDSLATDGLGITDLGDLGQLLPDWKGSSRDGYKIIDNQLNHFIKNRKDLLYLNLFIEKEISDRIVNDPIILRNSKTEFKRNHPKIINIEKS